MPVKYSLKLITLLILFAPLSAPVSSLSPTLAVSMHQDKIVCEQNQDALYNRGQVLTNLAEILNNSAPTFRKYEPRGLEVVKDKPRRFFIYDLTDPSNTGTSLGSCVQLLNKHVYHVAPMYLPYSFSHILFLDDGQLKVFRSVNCNGGDRIEDVLNYLKANLPDNGKKSETLTRVQAYRDHGVYVTIDDTRVRCDEVKLNND